MKKLLLLILGVVCALTSTAQQTLWVGQVYTCESTHAGSPVLVKDVKWTFTPSNLLTVKGSGLYRDVTPTAYFSGTVTVKMTCKYSFGYGSSYMSGTETWRISCQSNPLKISTTSVTLKQGASEYLVPSLTYTNKYSSSVKYSFTGYNTNIISVSADGKITGLTVGTTTITVCSTHSANQCTCQVTVTQPEVVPTSVNITSNIGSIKIGDVYSLTATVLPSNATNKTITWSSSAPSVISVNASTGVITGKSVGYATITAKTSNGLTSSKVIECKDNVTAITINDATGVTGTLPSVAHVSYERKFLKGWNTMCVPFAVTTTMLNNSNQGLRIAIVKEIEVEGDRRNIVLQSMDNVRAGQPCLVYATTDVTWSVGLKSVSLVNAPLTDSILKGSFSTSTIGAGCLKLTEDGTSFGKTKTVSATVHPFRCYIKQ